MSSRIWSGEFIQETIHPEPLIAARLAEPREIPKGAATLIKRAESLGWFVRPTYALGTTTYSPQSKVGIPKELFNSDGTLSRLIHSVAARMAYPTSDTVHSRAVVVWHVEAVEPYHEIPATGWRADTAFIWEADAFTKRIIDVPHMSSVTLVREFLETRELKARPPKKPAARKPSSSASSRRKNEEAS